jgi:hypothetical protein
MRIDALSLSEHGAYMVNTIPVFDLGRAFDFKKAWIIANAQSKK